MLEIKVYRDEENEVVVDGNVEGRTDVCCVELCEAFDSVLKTIAENEKPEVAEKLELATVASIVAGFIGRKAGRLDDEDFMDGMVHSTNKFLHGNIVLNSQEGREKIVGILKNLFADDEPEQSDGDTDGAE